MEMHTLSKEQLEEVCDKVKVVILCSLSKKLMTTAEADYWCQNHTIILRKQSIFRTFVSRVTKKESPELKFIVVEKT